MMGGAGHMQDMVNKIKANKELKNFRRSQRDKLTNLNRAKKIDLKFKKNSKKELNTINNRNRRLAKKERFRSNLVTVVIFIPILIIVLYCIRESLINVLK